MDCSSLLMQILEGFGDLDDDMAGQILAKVRQAHNLVEQLSSWSKLEDDVVVLCRLGEVDEPDDVWVVECLHNLDLLQDIGALPHMSVCGERLGGHGIPGTGGGRAASTKAINNAGVE